MGTEMSSGADLFVVCKQCGSEVSPYITECPTAAAGCAGVLPSCPARGLPNGHVVAPG